MHFETNFDLDEFLAYLVPGSICSIILYIKFSPMVITVIPKLNQYGPEYAILFLFTVFFIAISLAIGHLCSVLGRNIIRPLIYLIFGDPDFSIFVFRHGFWTDKEFYSVPLTKAVSNRFKAAFGLAMEDRKLVRAVPRLIRSYVFLRAPMAIVVRDRIVRARSICGNLIFPTLLAIILFYADLGFVYSGALLGSAILLIVKQMSLDSRESKELYAAFLGLDMGRGPPGTGHANNQNSHNG